MIELLSENYIPITSPAAATVANSNIADKGSVKTIGKIQGVLFDNTPVNEDATYFVEADAAGAPAGSTFHPGDTVYYDPVQKKIYNSAAQGRLKFGYALETGAIGENVSFRFIQEIKA